MPFNGKVALVTGGASGIGRATALRFAQEGADVIIADLDADNGERVVAQARSEGTDSSFERVDLTSLDEIKRLVARVLERKGRIDILANVAAIYGSVPFLEMSPELWDRTIAIDLRAVYFLTQAVARHMVAAGAGAIVNVASGAAFRPIAGQSHYTAAKGGLVAMTRTIALELAAHGIRVNVVAPGHTASETILRTRTPEDLQATVKDMLSGRWMEPEEVAEAIVFLASDAARAMTGAILNVNGGNYMPH
jgi:3-oxoacyl-[acyl-carrier protein] reductase